MNFRINVYETRSVTVEVTAGNEDEAAIKADKMFEDGEIICTHFSHVEYENAQTGEPIEV